DIRPNTIEMIKLPGGGVFDGKKYLGEQFKEGVPDFFTALHNEQLDPFLLEHPEFVNKAK
ncbi:LytR family transcriptional regulator, partial [Micromonospora sp. M51]|nr:LytR family transcriptional regulator [Micromonospora sp. M51]